MKIIWLRVLFECCLPMNNVVTVCFSCLGDTGSLSYAWSSKFCHILMCNIKSSHFVSIVNITRMHFLISGSLLGQQCFQVFHGFTISGLIKEYIKWKKATNRSFSDLCFFYSDLCLFYSYSLFICLHFEKCMERHIFFIW